ncbi:hypothetical protein Nepgr_011378 [Nepenthes gracilis]|uniref:Uncharacterized protein n=1 Tax=Nepenthes gracilis TaxID=150966 RepID=A0AAD3XLX6_NEPGR|nr:hypothetical protein Nepgr_011378 [Nepenthes gracilis]
MYPHSVKQNSLGVYSKPLMASKCFRFISGKSSLSLKSSLKSNVRSTSSAKYRASSSSSTFPPLLRPNSLPTRGFCFSRLPSELGCVQSLLPLHSAVAAARMTSCLSTTSRNCRANSQGLGLSVPR